MIKVFAFVNQRLDNELLAKYM